MSRKKCTIDDNFFTRLFDLMGKLGYGKREQCKFADKINISATYLSGILKRKKNPSFDMIYAIANKFPKVNIHWLLTGEEEMLRKELDDTSIYKGAMDEDPEVARLLTMTREIVKSGTEYAFSLKANIGSFHNAMLLERRVHDHEKRLALVEKVKSKICGGGGPDPPGKKNDPGKRGVM